IGVCGGELAVYEDGRRVITEAPEVDALNRIRDEYVTNYWRYAFHPLVCQLADLVEAFGARPTTANGFDGRGSPFAQLVLAILHTVPIDMQVHGARSIEHDGWESFNKAVTRAIATRRDHGRIASRFPTREEAETWLSRHEALQQALQRLRDS